jgi:hypothetical protein
MDTGGGIAFFHSIPRINGDNQFPATFDLQPESEATKYRESTAPAVAGGFTTAVLQSPVLRGSRGDSSPSG